MDQPSLKNPATASGDVSRRWRSGLEPLASFSWTPWLIVASGFLLVFLTVTWLVFTHEEVQTFDRICKDTMKTHAQNHAPMRHFFWLVTWLGGVVGLTLLSTVGTVTMFLRKNYLLAAIWVLAAGGGALVN